MHSAHVREGRPDQTCEAHSRAAAAYAGEALAGVGLYFAAFLAALVHDMGKFTDEFLEYLRQAAQGIARRGSVIHTFAAVRFFLKKHEPKPLELGFADITAEILAEAVGSHHGFFDVYNADGENGFQHRMEKQPEYDERAFRAFLQECAGEDELNRLFDRAVEEVTAVLNRIDALCDTDEELQFMVGLLVRLLTSAVVEGDRRDTAEYMSDRRVGVCPPADAALWERCSRAIEARIGRFECREPIQIARRAFSDECRAFADQPSGVYRLDLPTGGGKTLAGLRYAVAHAQAQGKRRIFYVAPLLSIIDQNAKEIREALGGEATVLEHHSNLVRERDDSETLGMEEILQETWDAPVIITTLVRLLDTLFSGRMSEVRRFKSLCGSVLIFDEIQSLPNKTLSMFNLAINFLTEICGATVILCSATQPTLDKVEHPIRLSEKKVVSEETLEHYAPIFRRTRLLDAGRMRLEDIPAWLTSVMDADERLLVVCNTKREAAALFERLDLPGTLRFHLSAGMCMAHRKRALDELRAALDAKKRLICVSTQVIEAGIDVSFSKVIRLTAGLDNAVQAAGRCNRHGESPGPRPVYLLRAEDEKLGSLTEIQDAQNALNALLAEYAQHPEAFDGDLASNRAVEFYYKYLYGHQKNNAQNYPLRGGGTLLELLSENAHRAAKNAHPEFWFLRQAFQTAGKEFTVFDDQTESVLTPYGEGAALIVNLNGERARYDFEYAKAQLEMAKEYSVSLFPDAVRRLRAENAVYEIGVGVLALRPEYYDEYTGVLSAAKEGASACDIQIL